MGGGRTGLRPCLIALAALTASAVIAPALEPTTPLAGYSRQSWVMENGLPQNTVQALAQTRDGFVWLGTEVGLVRFDGNSFQIFDKTSSPALPGNDVHCLLAASDGSLWVGTSEGLARLKAGAVETFSTENGLPGNDIRTLGEGPGGSVVVVHTSSGLANVTLDRVDAAGPGAAEENSGLLATVKGGLAAIATNGRLDLVRQKKIEQQLSVGKDLPGTRIQVLFADREGTLWIGTNGGLVRWREGKVERLAVTDALASESVLAVIEDLEGDIWAGTETGGLHILRDQRFKALTSRDGLSSDNTTAVLEDGHGTLWVGTAGEGLNAIRPEDQGGPVRHFTLKEGLLSNVILSLAAGQNGDLWVGTPDGLSRIRSGAVSSFTSAEGLPDDFIRSLLVDGDGSLWIGTRRGLTHWTGMQGHGASAARMETYTHADGLGSDLVGAMTRDEAGDLWVATLAGLSRLHGGTITNFTTKDGLSSNVITALLAEKSGWLVVGTQDHGWNIWDGHSFSVKPEEHSQTPGVHAILNDGRHRLWFATTDGIAMCGRLAIGTCGSLFEFGTADGLRGRETATNSHPSAWRSADDRLWFATPKGVEIVDPEHFEFNQTPPPVALERFAVDDVTQAFEASDALLKVPAGHNHFQFEYAGLSFVAPQKVRYRFILEGFDHAWTEAGARRTAYYTNIPPGTYTFRVQAANNDGNWNMSGASLRIELRPHFYQTYWFYGLVVLAVAGLVVLLLRLRLLRAEREFRAVLGERNRIAREIHDTLAQGYVGISVQLEVLSELLRHNKVEAAAKHLDTTRGFVREGLDDARQSIWSLRSQDANETTLPVRMRRLVEQEGNHGLEARFSIFGAYRPLPPGTEQELMRVAQEAIHNVRKHAAAKSLAVQLEYGHGEIALEVRDDGRGFAVNHDARKGTASESPPDSPPGHYGLTGMKERAVAVGGSLEITSAPGAGTCVRLKAPAPKGIKE